MADPLRSVSIAAPGFYGLNTQESGATLSSGYALSADNCVIDKFGRIGTRKGWKTINTSAGLLGENDASAIFEYVKVDGVKEILVAGNKKIFKLDGTSFVELYSDATLTSDKWQIVQLKNNVLFFQSGVEPLYYDGTSIVKISASTGYVATAPQAKIAITAFGRVWAANTNLNKVVLYWSDLLNGNVWSTGTAGSLDLTTVFPNGMDEITGLAAHNGFLVIFCRKCVLVYSNADTPASMALSDVIPGIGCIAPYSVTNTGNDLLFLSDRGLMSFGSLVQEKALPQHDLSKNVRDDLLTNLSGENFDNINSVYYEKEAFYLLTLPSINRTYCFDMRARLENGAARVTIWPNFCPKSMRVLRDRRLLLGFKGYVGEHSGYTDNGSPYRMTYYTNYFDFNDATSLLKILKKISFVIIGGQGQSFVTKWAFDYSSSFNSSGTKLPGAKIAEYNESEFGVGEYTGGTILATVTQQVSGSGKLVQVGIEAEITGAALSLQKIDVYCKTGRL